MDSLPELGFTFNMSTKANSYPGLSDKPSNLVQLLQWRTMHQPERRAYTFLLDGETEEVHLTYSELDQRARAIGAILQRSSAVGDRALLLYPPGLEYICAFFGCLYAGVIAVPAYPPRLKRNLSRIQGLLTDSGATLALTTTKLNRQMEREVELGSYSKDFHWLTTDNVPEELADDWKEIAFDGEAIAFLQYTSGSTAAPRGVIVGHRNLVQNLELIHQCFENTPESRGVIWLPPYHDMGLIGGVLQPLYAGHPVVLMSPFAFLQRPIRWLQAISRIRATHSGGPNFAYELCLRKVNREQLQSIDLSSWEVAFNGAEPIREEVLEKFAATFAPCGFRRQAFYPCYGLAEATLIVSGGDKQKPPAICHYQPAALETHRVLSHLETNEVLPTLVGCGKALLDHRILIVDPVSLTSCAPDEVGEIWISGPSVSRGYWNQPEETDRVFRGYLSNTGEGPFLRTGDLGFLKDGELFVTGRIKELIIIQGRNHYPQDIECTSANSHPALRADCGAAFTAMLANEARLVVVQEVEHRQRHKLDGAIGAIRQAVAEEHGVQVSAIIIVEPGSIPRTSSGKIRRYECRARFLEGKLDVVVEWQSQIRSEPVTLGLSNSTEVASGVT